MNTGSNILLTGVTGFVGKVVLEELIRRKDELTLNKVYILIRKKINKKTGGEISPLDRFNLDVASSPCFSQLPKNWKNCITVISGDLKLNNLGIEESIVKNMQKDITKIINCAASVEFDLPLVDAAEANITSALNVLNFSRNCSKLDSFVNVSTAYVSPHPGDGVAVQEKLVNLPFDPEIIYQTILDGTANEKELMAKTGHPNTYTFTKCISEHILSRNKGNIPLAIVRPSIISASWQYPKSGWIDSYAAFAGFVSLIGSGLIKCLSANENTILDIVPCDDVATSIIDTSFWSTESGERPFIQHIVSGINRGCRIDTCLSGIESYFQKNPVHHWAKVKYVSNGKSSIHLKHLLHHTIPSNLVGTMLKLSGKEKQHRQVKSLLKRIEYLNTAFPYFTHNSFYFDVSTPIKMPLENKQYIELVCNGVYENLMKNKMTEKSLAGKNNKHPKKDLSWVRGQPEGNWAIRIASYIVRKGLRKCTESITFDRTSFENTMAHIDPDSLVVIVPNHRSYMDFILCSYLFFSHPELNIQIPQIAAANDFAKIPFLGWFFKQTHAFYIQRGQGKEDPQLKDKIQNLVVRNQTLEFFIEGARSRSRKFLKPKRGLLRALQNTGIPCTILPIAISYDLVAEENSFLSELRAEPKKSMKLRSLLKWTSRMIAGQVKLGRVHIACGSPVKMNSETDVYLVSKKIMSELQDKTVISDFHLKTFLHHNPIYGIDLEWLKKAIINRGGIVIDSPLEDNILIDPLNELTMRYQWIHHFYADLINLFPNHPVIEYHIAENDYADKSLNNSQVFKDEKYKDLKPFLYEISTPLFNEYKYILELSSKNKGNLPDAKTLVSKSKNSFLPYVEEALSLLTKKNIIQPNKDENGFIAGSNWSELNSFYSSCHCSKENMMEEKLG